MVKKTSLCGHEPETSLCYMVIWTKPRSGRPLFWLSMWHVMLVLLFEGGRGGVDSTFGGFLLPPSRGHHVVAHCVYARLAAGCR